ncbi:MAG: XkdQ/YqbQ family protein [Eubacteriales bacterium]|jgi:hypothetical protein
MQLWLENRQTGQMVEITGACVEIQLCHKRNNGASVLDVTWLCEEVFFENGCTIRLTDGQQCAFHGRLFRWSRSSDGLVHLHAYDQLRYLKAKDTMLLQGRSLASLLREMCRVFQLKAGTMEDPPGLVQDEMLVGQTLLDILYRKIAEVQRLTGKAYILRDEDGAICLRAEDSLHLPLLLADETTCLSYEVERDIDRDTCNRVVLAHESIVFGMRKVYETADAQQTQQYGVLQYYQRVNQNLTSAQIRAIGENLLAEKKGERYRISLSAISDLSVQGGSVIGVTLDGLGQGLYRVLQVTHRLQSGRETMELEVENIAG